MNTLLEVADVGRALGLTPNGVRWIVRTGGLRPAVITSRGSRLFRVRDVERLRRQREARAATAGR